MTDLWSIHFKRLNLLENLDSALQYCHLLPLCSILIESWIIHDLIASRSSDRVVRFQGTLLLFERVINDPPWQFWNSYPFIPSSPKAAFRTLNDSRIVLEPTINDSRVGQKYLEQVVSRLVLFSVLCTHASNCMNDPRIVLHTAKWMVRNDTKRQINGEYIYWTDQETVRER